MYLEYDTSTGLIIVPYLLSFFVVPFALLEDVCLVVGCFSLLSFFFCSLFEYAGPEWPRFAAGLRSLMTNQT